MKAKNFNKVYPYTYYIKRKKDGLQYHGVRVNNVKLNRTPEEDFGVYYFTSGKFKKEFKEFPENFIWRFCWTFDTPEEAVLHETKTNQKIFKKLSWANLYGKYVPVESAKIGRKKMFLLNYGVDHNSKIPSVVAQRKQTFIKKYGVDNPTKSVVVLDKIKQTNLKRFGVEWTGQSTTLKEKIKNVFLKKYAFGHPSRCERVKKKKNDTNLKKYGVEHTFQSKPVIEKIHKKRKEMYIRLSKMTDNEFLLYLSKISQCPSVQSQKKSQREIGNLLLKSNVV
jgi:hypothetical protein